LRQAIAVVLVLAVPGGALVAPSVHAHPADQTTGHHHARTIHSHFSGHSHEHRDAHPSADSDRPAVRGTSDNDRAIYLGPFLAVAARLFYSSVLVHSTFRLGVPIEISAHEAFEVYHGHDPPILATLPARAPPILLPKSF
jgi:hypothetical protein